MAHLSRGHSLYTNHFTLFFVRCIGGLEQYKLLSLKPHTALRPRASCFPSLLARVGISGSVVAVDAEAGYSDQFVLLAGPAAAGLVTPSDVVEAGVAALPLLVDLCAGIDAEERASSQHDRGLLPVSISGPSSIRGGEGLTEMEECLGCFDGASCVGLAFGVWCSVPLLFWPARRRALFWFLLVPWSRAGFGLCRSRLSNNSGKLAQTGAPRGPRIKA